MKESTVEQYLVDQVKALGGEVRKVKWIGRNGAPDRLVMLPHDLDTTHGCYAPNTIWVELKNPDTILTFPSGPHERQQHREHERMRAMGQRVEVIGTKEGVDALLA